MSLDQLKTRFNLIKEIHKGQLANSYFAEDTKNKQKVFLKILNPVFKEDKQIIQMFEREVKSASNIHHRNVVKLIESGIIDGQQYICFQWIEGIPLNQFIKSSKDDKTDSSPLPINRVIDYGIQILDGLSEIHRAGIVHRDLKPANILADKSDCIHILDFSLAFAPFDTRLTAHNNIVGTPGYLAPEVVAGGEAGIKSDLFAAGIIIFELLSGVTLFTAEDIYTTLQKIHEAELPEIDDLRKGLSPEIKSFLIKILAKHPADRFNSAKEAKNELEKIKSQPVETEIIDEPLKPAKRQVSINILLAFALIALTVSLTVKYYVPEKANPNITPKNETVDSELPRSIEKSDSIQTAKVIPVKKSETIPRTESGSNKTDSTTSVKEYLLTDTATIAVDKIALDSLVVKFEVSPWAKIYMDNDLLGTTPMLSFKKIPSGSHEFRFEHNEFPVLRKRIELSGSSDSLVRINLANEFGRLDFAVVPWGYLFIDGIEKGVIPLPNPVYVSHGEHEIVIKHPDFPAIKKTVSVSAGEKLLIREDFTGN